MEKIYGMHKLVGLQLFWSGTPTFSSGTPTFCQMGVLNSCFQNPSESSGYKVASSGPEVIKLFSCSTELTTKYQLLIKTKIPTNEEVFCFKSLRCGIYHANKC